MKISKTLIIGSLFSYCILNSILCPGSDYSQSEKYLDEAIYWGSLGNHDKAIQLLEEAIKSNPKCFLCLRNLGNAYGNKGDYDKAIIYFNEALKINPKDNVTLYSLGLTEAKKKSYGKAITYYREALKYGDYPETRFMLGMAYMLSGQLKDAINEVYKAGEVFKAEKNFEMLLKSIDFLEKAGEKEKARKLREGY